uniref:Integrator complex subunit 7 n=1 Tax=Sinocyclocheilus rhinocerous TaxID=307959 RepID=A0A673FS35_9TELE
MSLSAARSFLSEAAYGEQELDANSALMELDKGLRSCKLGEQCEAVVLFPKLFQKYPFPILINSAFLKLADIFRLGNNFLRLCVLKVTQLSEKHLEKILNVDEFVKRVFSVIHSNDPVARAITLRMLGSLASIIPERKNAHHSIRQSLDSHDNVEVEAAIFAAASFSSHSNVDSFIDYNVFISVFLFVLKIRLLLQYLKEDPRKAVKRLAIQDLKLLAIKAPHLWTRKNIQVLCECALSTPYNSLKLGMLSVLSTLSGTIAIKQYVSPNTGEASPAPRHTDLVKLAQECCYHSNLAVAAHGITVLTSITVSCPEKEVIQLEQEAVMGMESLILLCSQDDRKTAQATLKTALTSLVKMLKSCPHLSQSSVELLLAQLHCACDSARVLMCQALAAIATQQPVLAEGMLGDLLDLFRVASHRTSEKQQELLVSLATVLFVASQASLSAEVKTVIRQQLENVANGWTVYRIARQASRMTTLLFVSTSLSGLSDGDYSAAMSAISEALKSYQKGICAASTPLSPLTFQCEFVKLRIDTLQALSQLICTCNSLKTSPPPAIATTIAPSSGSELQHCGRISTQMKLAMDEFRSLAARYADLYQSSFDADYATLRNVELQQQSCLLVSYVIEALVIDPQTASFQEFGTHGSVLAESEYELRMLAVFNHVLEEVENLSRKHPPVSYLHTGCLCGAVIAILKVPLSFQRYFFQKLQSTSIKPSATASNARPNEPIRERNEEKIRFTLQHTYYFELLIQATLDNLKSHHMTPLNDSMTNLPPTTDKSCAQFTNLCTILFHFVFLLNFSILGTHMVSVEASVVDTSGIELKSLEDPYSQQLRHQLQQQQQTGPQPGPQRTTLPRQ